MGSAVTAAAAEQAAPVVSIAGQEASYIEVTGGGTYENNELKLVGDSTTYNLDKTNLRPQLPQKIYHGGAVKIWVYRGSNRVVAIELRDETDSNPTTYKTQEFDGSAK